MDKTYKALVETSRDVYAVRVEAEHIQAAYDVLADRYSHELPNGESLESIAVESEDGTEWMGM